MNRIRVDHPHPAMNTQFMVRVPKEVKAELEELARQKRKEDGAPWTTSSVVRWLIERELASRDTRKAKK